MSPPPTARGTVSSPTLSPASRKAAYIGEFSYQKEFIVDEGQIVETMDVPWTTVKDIMHAIRVRATHGG